MWGFSCFGVWGILDSGSGVLILGCGVVDCGLMVLELRFSLLSLFGMNPKFRLPWF